MANNQQNPQYAPQNQTGYPAQPVNSGYYQQPLPPINNQQNQDPYFGPPMDPHLLRGNQYSSRPNSGRKEADQNYAYSNAPPQPNYYQQEAPNQYGHGAPNPYPQNVAPDVHRAVQGESKWKKATCLDCITKLKGEEERQGFVRKVFGILSAQILFTVILWSIVYATPSLEKWLQENIWFYFICLFFSIVILCAIVCVRRIARTTPYNYIALFSYTFFESVMIATFSSFFTAESVFIAAVMTLVLFTTMTIVALFTSRKPHTLAMMMYACFGLSIIMIFFLIFFTNRYIVIIAMVVLLIIAWVYVMIDIDLITEKHGLSVDDYIIGALFLYIDIVMIFIYILALCGDRG